jgi:hypothetical protein
MADGQRMGQVTIKFAGPDASNLTLEKPQLWEYLEASPYRVTGIEKAGRFPYKHCLVTFDTKADAMELTEHCRGSMKVGEITYELSYRGKHASRLDAEVRLMPTVYEDGNPVPIGYGQQSHAAVLPIFRALCNDPPLRSCRFVYTMAFPGIDRRRGNVSTVMAHWHSQVPGADDEETMSNLPYTMLIPDSEGQDNRGIHACFFVFKHWGLRCTVCFKKGHVAGCEVCPSNPQGLQRRAQDARRAIVNEAVARRAEGVQAAQARRPDANVRQRNVRPRRDQY